MKDVLLAITLGFSITFLIGLIIYPLLKKLKAGQPILGYVKEHAKKSGTPTMGGIMFILGIPIAFFIVCGVSSIYSLITITATAAFGLIGFLDDFIKVKFSRNMGLRAYQKIVFQVLVAVTVSLFLYMSKVTTIRIPFTEYVFDIGAWVIPLVIFVMLSMTNSVNLTDGLDGLSGGVSLIYVAAFLIMIFFEAAVYMNFGMANYHEYHDLYTLCAAGIGGISAFLAFNSYPAKLFMGDTGSMALGAFTACIGILSGFTLFIPIIGIMFVASSLSVIIQVVGFKMRGKRVFLMAPLHHHFQQLGISETRITTSYMIVTMLMALVTIVLTF